jgi:hypothetical protein
MPPRIDRACEKLRANSHREIRLQNQMNIKVEQLLADEGDTPAMTSTRCYGGFMRRRWWLVAIGVVIMGMACSVPNPLDCADGTCTDPGHPSAT